jgi:ABC-type transport system involved in cytochrome c biogenesis permease subunit
MTEISIIWLRVATALYAIGLLHAILTILRQESRLFRFALGAFFTGVVLHFVAIVQLGVVSGRLPVNNFNESMSLCAFLIAIAYLIVQWRYQFSGLSVFVFPLVFLMTQIGSMEFPVGSWADTRVRGAWLVMHIFLILLGYAALALTALASVFYLIRERQLKRKTSSSLFERLPPLATLDNLITRFMAFGFVFITLGVIAAITWAFIDKGTQWIFEPTVIISLATWLFYLVMVFLRVTAGWRGRKAALMALSVLGCSVLTWITHLSLRSAFIR